MEMVDQTNCSYSKSKILQTYVSKSLEGFNADDDAYQKLIDTKFAIMKKLTTPALEFGLSIANSIDINHSYSNLSQFSLSKYEQIKANTLLPKQFLSEMRDLKNGQKREFETSSIDPNEGNISETRSLSGVSEAKIDIEDQNDNKKCESDGCNKLDFKKPQAIVAGVKRKLCNEKSEFTKATESKTFKYESVLDPYRKQKNSTVFH